MKSKTTPLWIAWVFISLLCACSNEDPKTGLNDAPAIPLPAVTVRPENRPPATTVATTFQLPKTLHARQQSFQVQPMRDTLILGDAGTRVFFPANCLEGVQDEPVTITLKECYDYGSMLAAQLSTSSNGQLLETGGMIELRAYSNGRELELKEDAKVLIQMKELTQPEGFQLFTGIRSPDGNINWELQPNSTDIRQEFSDRDSLMPVEYRVGFQSDNLIEQLDHPYLYLRDSFETPLAKHIEDYFPLAKDSVSAFVRTYGTSFITFSFQLSPKGKIRMAWVNNANNRAFNKYVKTYVKKLPPLDYTTTRKENQTDYVPTFKVSIATIPISDRRLYLNNAQKLLSYEQTFAQVAQGNSLNAGNIFASTTLGWINCDRFYSSPQPKINQQIASKQPTVNKAFIIFRNIRSIMDATQNADGFVVNNIPKGEKATLIAFSGTGETVKVCKKELTIGETQVEITPADLKALKPEELKTLLAQL